jgi:lipoate-protein ligase A
MAADEVMLQAAERGTTALRFYTWDEPTLSLGYFQPAAARLTDPLLADRTWVRRPSGGAAILHHWELTYCLVLPAGLQGKRNWVCTFHDLVAAALRSFGVELHAVGCGEEKKLGDYLCFLHQTPGDLLIDSSKVAGSAQRKRRGALMQHGSILLAQSPCTPALPGIAELSGKRLGAEELTERLAGLFRKQMNWDLRESEFTDEEERQIAEMAREKYQSIEWNEKR